MAWSDLLSRPRPTPTASFVVGQASTNVADLWLPKGPGPHPTVLMVHGGCWQKAVADRTLMNYAAEALSEEGFAVWNIEYRGVDESGGGYPGTFLDAALAADALRDKAAAYNIDLSRLAAYGHSAGGHLALWLAARHRLPATSPLYTNNPIDIRAVVNTGGLADLEASAPVTLESCLAAIIDDLTGAPTSDRANVFADTSPSSLLPTGAKQISVNARRDRIAPPELGRAYTEKARAAGDTAEFVLVDGGHVELIAPGTPAFDRTIKVLRALVAEPRD